MWPSHSSGLRLSGSLTVLSGADQAITIIELLFHGGLSPVIPPFGTFFRCLLGCWYSRPPEFSSPPRKSAASLPHRVVPSEVSTPMFGLLLINFSAPDLSP